MNTKNILQNEYFTIRSLIKESGLTQNSKINLLVNIEGQKSSLEHNLKTLKEEIEEIEDSLKLLNELKKEIEEKESK